MNPKSDESPPSSGRDMNGSGAQTQNVEAGVCLGKGRQSTQNRKQRRVQHSHMSGPLIIKARLVQADAGSLQGSDLPKAWPLHSNAESPSGYDLPNGSWQSHYVYTGSPKWPGDRVTSGCKLSTEGAAVTEQEFKFVPSDLSTLASPTRNKFGISVVNVRKAELKKIGYNDLVDWLRDPNHVYIGRDMTRYVPGAVGSKWGNPFKARGDNLTVEERCDMYKQYILNDTRIQGNGKTLLESLDELKGKVLGCWCHPAPCHGHMLADLAQKHCY
ncbi:uncharacterized protein LOC128205543 [Mya arenaria]|uniref:uncharacterized protein LOC128205543 n=1 Tax=Mya arenaria TaxID=6604 RepID=UPI0022E7883B|nr:uncharacterized protein LOC128205543 [Mya arenaria]